MVHRGPVKDRSCTDVLCLLVFIAFLVGWGIVGYFGTTLHLVLMMTSFFFFSYIFLSSFLTGFVLGDPQRLVHPTDSQGRICGVDEKLKDKPYLHFFDLTRCANPAVLATGCQTPQVFHFL